jgi:hypothetical protein
MTIKKKNKVNGENIMYHYIQKNLISSDGITNFQKQLIVNSDYERTYGTYLSKKLLWLSPLFSITLIIG